MVATTDQEIEVVIGGGGQDQDQGVQTGIVETMVVVVGTDTEGETGNEKVHCTYFVIAIVKGLLHEIKVSSTCFALPRYCKSATPPSLELE